MSADVIRKIKLLVLDVDGVLTDGSILIDDHGVEIKRFHVRDGTGITLWRKLGYQTAIITGRKGMAVTHRARELGIDHVMQGRFHKAPQFRELLTKLNMSASQAAAIADDLTDLPVLRLAGYAMAVADASAEIRAAANFVTSSPGGRGAVREAIEHLLKVQGRWDEALALIEE